jgi:hypothetical protein
MYLSRERIFDVSTDKFLLGELTRYLLLFGEIERHANVWNRDSVKRIDRDDTTFLSDNIVDKASRGPRKSAIFFLSKTVGRVDFLKESFDSDCMNR